MNFFSKLKILVILFLTFIISLNEGFSNMTYTLVTKNIRRIELDNGMVAILNHNPNLPKIGITLSVNVGLSEHNFFGTEMAHLFEHLLINFDNNNSYKNFSTMGSTSSNGSTSFNTTNYFHLLENRHLEKAIQEFAKFVDPKKTFSKQQIKNEIEIILKEKNVRLDHPWYNLFFNLFNQTSKKSNVVGVTRYLYQTIHSLSEEDVNNFYRNHYIPQNYTLIISGDFNFDEAENYIIKYFASFKAGSNYKPVPHDIMEIQAAPHHAYKGANNQNLHYGMGFAYPHFNKNDLLIIELISHMLDISLVIEEKLKIKKEIISHYSTYFPLSLLPRHEFFFTILFPNLKTKKLEDIELIKNIVWSEIEKLQKNPDPNFIEVAKNQLILEFKIASKDPLFEAHLLEHLDEHHMLEIFPHYAKSIKNISIEDIKRVATTYFSPNYMNTLTLFPKKEEKSLKKAILAQQNPAIEKQTSIANFEEKIKKAYDNIQEITLKNGIKVFLNYDPKSDLNYFNFYQHKLDKEFIPVDKLGSINLIKSLLTKGTQKKSELEIKMLIHKLGKLSIGSETIGLVLKENFYSLFDLGLEILFTPNFKEHLEKAKKEQIFFIKTSSDNHKVANIWHTISKFDKYKGVTPEKAIQTIEKLKLSDIEEIYESTLSNLAVFVYGDFDQQKILSKLEALNIKKPSKSLFTNTVIEPSIKEIKQYDYKLASKKIQSSISFTFNPIDITNEKNYALLSILAQVLNNHEMETGLFYNLRVLEDLVYLVGAKKLPFFKRKLLQIYVQSVEEKNKKVINVITEYLKNLKMNSVPESSLKVAKLSLIGKIQDSFLNIGSNLSVSFMESKFFNGSIQPNKLIKVIQSITKSEFDEFVKEYLDKHFIITISPAQSDSK